MYFFNLKNTFFRKQKQVWTSHAVYVCAGVIKEGVKIDKYDKG